MVEFPLNIHLEVLLFCFRCLDGFSGEQCKEKDTRVSSSVSALDITLLGLVAGLIAAVLGLCLGVCFLFKRVRNNIRYIRVQYQL